MHSRPHRPDLRPTRDGRPDQTGYGLGWWVDTRPGGLVTDAGAYGAVPWLDVVDGYGAYLVIEADGLTGLDLADRLFVPVEQAVTRPATRTAAPLTRSGGCREAGHAGDDRVEVPPIEHRSFTADRVLVDRQQLIDLGEARPAAAVPSAPVPTGISSSR